METNENEPNNEEINSMEIVTDEREDYELVIDGLSKWLNNKPSESEEFFKANSDRTSVLAGYAFVLCMVNKRQF